MAVDERDCSNVLDGEVSNVGKEEGYSWKELGMGWAQWFWVAAHRIVGKE